METKEQSLGELQGWQEQILAMEEFKDSLEMWIEEEEKEDEIPITKAQSDMLEKVLGDDFYIGDEEIREILKDVFECGFYYERDRKVLNFARECYLEGRNWIKKNG